MNSKSMYVVIGTVALFLCSAMLPSLAYDDVHVEKNLVGIEITEYLSDGSLVTTVVRISSEQIDELRESYFKATSNEERFELLKDYQIIPQERMMTDFEQGMYERAADLGLTTETIERMALLLDPVVKRRFPILIDFFTRVSTVHMWGNSLRIGLSPFIGYLNYLRNWNLPKADFLDLAWGLMGVVDTEGLLNRHSMVSFPGAMCLLGFVGYNVKLPFFVHNYYGYAAVTLAAGLGSHTVIWFYWLNQLT